MKPLKQNTKKPRGAAVDAERERLKGYADRLCFEAGCKLAGAADHLFKIKETDLAATARRLRREIGLLQSRIERLDVVADVVVS